MPFDGRQGATSWPPCTHEAVEQIVQTRDRPLRNLGITQSYHQLTVAVGRRMGFSDVPWTGFAVWASRTAGVFIRQDWVPERLQALVSRHDGELARRIRGVDERLRHYVAHGNCIVYAEIAPFFVDLVSLLDTPAAQRPERAQRVLARLRPGPVEHGGQEPLARALRAYLEAATCTDDRRRAQLVLMANLLIGFHEQWRLQPEIMGSLDSIWTALPSPHTRWQAQLRDRVSQQLRRGLTRMMKIRTPTPLRLGRDLPRLADGREFPSPLERIELAPLGDLLARFDRTPDTTRGSAAGDWSDLDDRMNFLVDLFRTRQRDPALWGPPFGSGQVQALARHELPPGRL